MPPDPAAARRQRTAAIQRSVRAMTIGTLRAHERRKKRDVQESLAEMDQHFQIPVSGEAGSSPVWFDVEVDFSSTFMVAPEMRDTPYEEPLFTFGAVTAASVFITANVLKWKTDSSNNFIGATINIGVYMPGATVLTQFRGHVHCNFQGYGAMDQADDSED